MKTALGGWVIASASTPAVAASNDGRTLVREIGITTGSFMRHLATEPQAGKLRLLDLPRIMRDELDMRVIDLMTATLVSLETPYLEGLRAAAEMSSCLLTNLKMNLTGFELGQADKEVRQRALREYKKAIDAAAVLGVRWVRPLPGGMRPELAAYAADYREMIDYAGRHGISLLIENNGWMRSDPDAIPNVVKAVGKGLAAQPDTGNWANNEARYAGLASAFPLAVSCDFKAFKLGPNGEHEAYDLKRCFKIGWEAGFRGPWCLEHAHEDLKSLYRELGLLRDSLRRWMAEQG